MNIRTRARIFIRNQTFISEWLVRKYMEMARTRSRIAPKLRVYKFID